MFNTTEKYLVMDDPDYTAELSYELGEVWLHLRVSKYDQEVYQRLVDDFLNLEEALKELGVEDIFACPEKRSLCEKMGWEKIGEIPTGLGESRGIYVWAV